MKKLLILAYDFPPYVSVGGLRPYSWYRYLKEFGVEPIVITRNWTNDHGNELDYITPSPTKNTVVEQTEWGTVIRTPYKPTWSNRLLLKYGTTKFRFLRKTLTAIGEIKQFITISGPKKQLYFAAENYLKSTKVDAIIATGDPFVLFFYANKLGKKFKTPWIADYRDPWSQSKSFQQNRIFYKWNRYLEKKLVSQSDQIISVSDFFKFRISQLIPNKLIHVFPNGYDPDLIDEATLINQSNDHLTIAFVGTVYEWHPWKGFIDQISELVGNSTHQIRLNFYGVNNADEIKNYLNRFSLEIRNTVRIYPRMPNLELLKQIAQDNVMLLFNYYSFDGTKIYDYIGIKRKIIFCYKNDPTALILKSKYYQYEDADYNRLPQVDLIRETNAGVVVEDEAHLRVVLQELLQEFAENGKIDCNSVGVENYSRKIQVKKLAEIVSGIKNN